MLATAALIFTSATYVWQQQSLFPPLPGLGGTGKFRPISVSRKSAPAPGQDQPDAGAIASSSGAAAGSSETVHPARTASLAAEKAVVSTPPAEKDESKTQVAMADQPAPAAAPAQQQVEVAPPPDKPLPHQHPPYADGDFTGAPADCYWGSVQVELLIKGGVIDKVWLVQMPDHRARSNQISDWSAPIFAQEAIDAQDADVDIVSSATNTSVAYREALKNALTKATR